MYFVVSTRVLPHMSCSLFDRLFSPLFLSLRLHYNPYHRHCFHCAIPQPLVSIDTDVWPCLFNEILFPDITCGYGLDLVWTHCGRTAVLHNHAMVHKNLKPASNRPNFVMRCAAEGLALFQRLAHRGITPVDPAEVEPPAGLARTPIAD